MARKLKMRKGSTVVTVKGTDPRLGLRGFYKGVPAGAKGKVLYLHSYVERGPLFHGNVRVHLARVQWRWVDKNGKVKARTTDVNQWGDPFIEVLKY